MPLLASSHSLNVSFKTLFHTLISQNVWTHLLVCLGLCVDKVWSVSVHSVSRLTMSLNSGWVLLLFWVLIQNMVMSSAIIFMWWPWCKQTMLISGFVDEGGQQLSFTPALTRLPTPSQIILSYQLKDVIRWIGKSLVGWSGSEGQWVVL